MVIVQIERVVESTIIDLPLLTDPEHGAEPVENPYLSQIAKAGKTTVEIAVGFLISVLIQRKPLPPGQKVRPHQKKRKIDIPGVVDHGISSKNAKNTGPADPTGHPSTIPHRKRECGKQKEGKEETYEERSVVDIEKTPTPVSDIRLVQILIEGKEPALRVVRA